MNKSVRAWSYSARHVGQKGPEGSRQILIVEKVWWRWDIGFGIFCDIFVARCVNCFMVVARHYDNNNVIAGRRYQCENRNPENGVPLLLMH